MKGIKKRGGKNGRWIMALPALTFLVITTAYIAGSNVYREIKDLGEQLRVIRSEIEYLEGMTAKEDLIGAEWKAWIEEKERLHILLPRENEFPFVLVALEEAIRGYPVNLLSIQTGDKSFHQSHSKIRVNFTVSGHPSDLELFLRRMKRFPHFFTFDSIRWSRSGEEEIKLELVLELYFTDQIDTDLSRPAKKPVSEECVYKRGTTT